MNQFTGRHVQGAASAAKRRSARVAVVVELTKECRVMNNRRLIQGLIPLLYGLFVGMFIGWSVELWLPGHAAVAWRYLSLFGIAVLLLAIFLILRTGYSWPWEGPAETAPMSSKAYLRTAAVAFRRGAAARGLGIFPAGIQISRTLAARLIAQPRRRGEFRLVLPFPGRVCVCTCRFGRW
jgi:hypothetical protein